MKTSVGVVELEEARDREPLLGEVAQALEGHLERIGRKAGGLHSVLSFPRRPGLPRGARRTNEEDPLRILGSASELGGWEVGSHGETEALYPSRSQDTNREQV